MTLMFEEIPKAFAIGAPLAGGYFSGQFRLDNGDIYALIVSPKTEGDHDDAIWIPDYRDVPGALSYNDGLANTLAMAEAGSELARWARNLTIGGFDDWYLPSQDEQELLYRHLKPTARQNSCYARSGINLSAVDPTRPYTPSFPMQTSAEAFCSGGTEALEEEAYWSSTRHASDAGYAWSQDFLNGYQDDYDITSAQLRARAVRRLIIK